MYCQSCGTQMAPVLSYCPRCGAGQSLGKTADAGASSSPPVSPDSLTWAIVATTVVVLGLMLGGLMALKGNGVDEAMIWTFVMFCFLALIGVDAMFLRLLRGLRSAGRREIDTSQLKEAAPRQLGGAQRESLGDPVPSVTEHTTRTFEPALRGRGAEQQQQ